jgi:hypothetical protein
MLAESSIVEGDSGDISTLSYSVCNICSARLSSKDYKYRVADIVICFQCYCSE